MCNTYKVGGYAVADKDRETIHSKHLCELCKNVLKATIQTTCGHRYCYECLERTFVNGTTNCVVCQEPLTRDKIFRDKFADREIQNLILCCIYCAFGCKWRSQLRHREAHQNTCKFIPLTCVNRGCEKQVTKETLPNHLQNECQFREVLCSYCEQRVTFANLKEHEQQCPLFPVKCQDCSKEFPRREMKEHLNPSSVEVCEALKSQCPFAKIGCKEKMLKKHKEREVHLQKSIPEHLLLLLTMFCNFLPYLEELVPAKQNGKKAKLPQILQSVRDEIISHLSLRMDGLYNPINEKVKRLETKCESLSTVQGGLNGSTSQELLRRLADSDTKIADLEFLLNEAHNTIAELRQELTKNTVKSEKAEEAIRKMQRRLEEQENVAGIRNLAVADLEEKMNGVVNNSTDGILVWKIDQVARRRADATSGRQVSFYSPPFYTDPHGYKMCARIYLNGDGMGKGTHISLFFVIMRGEYDPLLKWPFRQKVTMMLLDQDNEEHVIDAFRPDPSSSSFQKPRGAMNIASGCPLFCPHSELQRHAYIRDDVMFIKIIVDRPDWK